MKNIKIYLKGWNNNRLYVNAVNDSSHVLHSEAWAVRDEMFMPYQPGHTVYLAFEYTSDDADALDLRLCDQAFEWFNIGDNAVARRYRARGNRSLSVGDVVVIDDRAYAVAMAGWDRIEDFAPVLAAR